MNDFLKMDVFFVVSTAAVVIVATLLSIAIFYAIRILRAADRLSQTVEAEAALVRDDLRDLRAGIRREGFRWKHISRWLKGFVSRSRLD